MWPRECCHAAWRPCLSAIRPLSAVFWAEQYVNMLTAYKILNEFCKRNLTKILQSSQGKEVLIDINSAKEI